MNTSPPVRTTAQRQKQYVSRRTTSKADIPKLTQTEEWVGVFSPWAIAAGIVFLTAPIAYIYIALILMRELCFTFSETIYAPIQHYIPVLGKIISAMQQSSRIVELWCIVEGVFFFGFKLYIRWLQSRDTLEACLSSAPLLRVPERQMLWKRMMESEYPSIDFLSGWFFDEPITKMSRYDVSDFLAWSMFEGRHQEHLTTAEHAQLDAFVDEVEHRISLMLHGALTEEEVSSSQHVSFASDSGGPRVDHDAPDFENEENWESLQASDSTTTASTSSSHESLCDSPSSSYATFYEFKKALPKPKRSKLQYCLFVGVSDRDLHLTHLVLVFHFEEKSPNQERKFFSELFESYRKRYEQMVSADFNPVKDLREMVASATPDLRNLVEGTKERIEKAEESAYATTRQVYETLVPSGSKMDKQLTAMSHATLVQLTDAWNSVKNMKERLETARFLSKQRQTIQQRLKGYRLLLNQMLESSSSSVPSKQMAGLMRRITECYEAMERLESRAEGAFVQATGFAYKNLPFIHHEEPQRFARYSSDPLMNISTYPLGLHLSVFACTEIPLRVMMARRGFERRVLGQVAYYFHPGQSDTFQEDDVATDKTPIVFVHGIGIGLIMYIPLIDALLETKRPLFFPEIPYVSAFRPWQSPNSVLQPAVVCNTMSAMLAYHGYLKGAWSGHSFGTSWVSYMCKYAPHAVAALLFLDPVCFCLHAPRLTKSFVYMPADPGTISYFVRTDLMVNWTIQRAFPWSWIVLFEEQINVPCSIFLSEKDQLVPSEIVEKYFRSKDIPIADFANVEPDFFRSDSMVNCCVFRGDGHGRWTETTESTIPTIHKAFEILCERAEQPSNLNKREHED